MTIFKDEYTFSRKCAFIFLLLSSLISAQSAFPRDFSSKIKPRFEIAEIDWPKTEGAASICLWSDDKLAAFSFGVDDNNHGNVDWWLEQCKVYMTRVRTWVTLGMVRTWVTLGMVRTWVTLPVFIDTNLLRSDNAVSFSRKETACAPKRKKNASMLSSNA